MNIAVIKDIERDEIEFICKSIGCRPVAHIDNFKPEMLGAADLVEETDAGDGKVVKVRERESSCVSSGIQALIVCAARLHSDYWCREARQDS